MNILIECKECGKQVSIDTNKSNQIVDFAKELFDKGFDISANIDVELKKEAVDNPNDVETELVNLYITCECGNFVYLSV